MTDRSDRIIMSDHEPRCEPLAQQCVMRSKCARVQAPIVSGSRSFPVEDFTVQANGGTAMCPGFLSIAERHVDNRRPPIRPAKPAVKGLV